MPAGRARSAVRTMRPDWPVRRNSYRSRSTPTGSASPVRTTSARGNHACSHAACCHSSRRPSIQLHEWQQADRKSTRLNSSHGSISYAVFCLKKKKKKKAAEKKNSSNDKNEYNLVNIQGISYSDVMSTYK